jgi:hypothetical protein
VVTAEPDAVTDEGVAVLAAAAEIEAIARAGVAAPYRGEVRIWGDDGYLTRICLFEGRIAWVYCNRRHEHLGDVLRRRANVTLWSLRRAMDHATKTGVNLGEALTALKIIPLPRLRAALHEHIQSHILAALDAEVVLRARFVPQEHRYRLGLTFEIDEFVWDRSCAANHPRPRLRAASDPLVARCVEALRSSDGGLLFGIVDLEQARVLAHAGHASEGAQAEALEILLADVLLRLDAVGGADGARPCGFVEELGLCFGETRCVTRASADGRVAYVLLTTASCPLGAAATHLRFVSEELESTWRTDLESAR